VLKGGVFGSEDARVYSLLLLLGDHLKVLVDDSYGEEDSGSRSIGSHEVSEDAETSNGETTRGSSSVNTFGKLLDHRHFSPSFNGEFLVHQLTHDISSVLSRAVNPELSEEDARARDESPVENCVEGVVYDLRDTLGSREPISESTNGDSLSKGFIFFPLSNERDEGVTLEFSVEEIGDHVEFADESSPHDDGDVRGIEQFDREGYFVTTYLSVTKSQFNAESLEVDNYKEDNHSSDQAGNVRRVVTEKGVLKG